MGNSLSIFTLASKRQLYTIGVQRFWEKLFQYQIILSLSNWIIILTKYGPHLGAFFRSRLQNTQNCPAIYIYIIYFLITLRNYLPCIFGINRVVYTRYQMFSAFALICFPIIYWSVKSGRLQRLLIELFLCFVICYLVWDLLLFSNFMTKEYTVKFTCKEMHIVFVRYKKKYSWIVIVLSISNLYYI